MFKRIFAWVLLVSFVLLILNILFWNILLGPSLIIYALIAVTFLFTNRKKR
jgi:membrane protein required for beta-lactamase induction